MSSHRKEEAPYADIATIGIPRALMYHRYAPAWTAFFEALGRTVVISRPTDLSMLERGSALSVDECCLASKAYMGHVESLIGACDAVFVPSLANLGRFRGFCTKYQALPDLVRNTFAETPLRIVSCAVETQETGTAMKDAFVELGMRFGASAGEAKAAFKAGQQALEDADARAHADLESALRTVEKARKHAARSDAETEPLAILVAAHPYVACDPIIGGPVVDTLRAMGVSVLFAHDFDHARAYKASKEFSSTMPWIVNRELIGAILCLHERIDGIVLVSAFPCGPDSMTNDAIARRIAGKPMLCLTVDAQSATAGLETRVESFVDILRYRRKGGYLR
ncbi:MAG: acyl-CoA dehydratase activase-related protein [Slackia sp.]|nr:acyl-CoA dehydratase activase-related protein [Slackia sp.]